MATLEPNAERIQEAMKLFMGICNSSDIGATDGIYAALLMAYVGSKNSLCMCDADYMRLCETIMHWGKEFLIDRPNPSAPTVDQAVSGGGE